MKIFSKFPTINISKLNFLLVISVANLYNFKGDFSQYLDLFCTLRFFPTSAVKLRFEPVAEGNCSIQKRVFRHSFVVFMFFYTCTVDMLYKRKITLVAVKYGIWPYRTATRVILLLYVWYCSYICVLHECRFDQSSIRWKTRWAFITFVVLSPPSVPIHFRLIKISVFLFCPHRCCCAAVHPSGI